MPVVSDASDSPPRRLLASPVSWAAGPPQTQWRRLSGPKPLDPPTSWGFQGHASATSPGAAGGPWECTAGAGGVNTPQGSSDQ